MKKLFTLTLILSLSACASNEQAQIEYGNNATITKNDDFKVTITKHSIDKTHNKEVESHSLTKKEVQPDIDGFIEEKQVLDTHQEESIEETNNNIQKSKNIPESEDLGDDDLNREIEKELKGGQNNEYNQPDIKEELSSQSPLEENWAGKFDIKPVTGKVIKKFSNDPHGEKFEAIIFASPKGGIVKSVSDGTVLYTGFDPKFGNIVIIGYKDFQIAYGYLQGFVVKKGNPISRASVIGYVGDIINSKNSGLYFAVRKNNIPIDPELML